MEQKYFKILEINNDATIEEVKLAYRDLVQIWHPDRISAKNPRFKLKAEEKMKQLNNARSQLNKYLTKKQEREEVTQGQAERERARQEQAERERARQEQAERERVRQEQAERERARQEQAERERVRQEQAERERVRQEQAEDFFRKRAEQIAAEAKSKENVNEDGIPLYLCPPQPMSDLKYRTIWAVVITTFTIMGFCIVASIVSSNEIVGAIVLVLITFGFPFFIVLFGVIWCFIPKKGKDYNTNL